MRNECLADQPIKAIDTELFFILGYTCDISCKFYLLSKQNSVANIYSIYLNLPFVCQRTSLMTWQHGIRYWLSVGWHQAISCSSVDSDLVYHMASQGCSEFMIHLHEHRISVSKAKFTIESWLYIHSWIKQWIFSQGKKIKHCPGKYPIFIYLIFMSQIVL